MLRGLYRRYVNYKRDSQFAARLKRERRPDGRPTIIVGSPFALFGAAYGRGIRRALQSVRKPTGNPKKMLAGVATALLGPMVYVVLWLVLAVGGVLPLVVAEMMTGRDVQAYASVVALVATAGAATPSLHAWYLARRDYRETQRLRELAERPSHEVAAEAFERVDARHPALRRNALRTLQPVCQETPGKLVKYLPEPPENIVEAFVARLDDDDGEATERAVVCLKWLSRDYGPTLVPHAGALAAAVQSPHSDVQAHAAVALGNVGRHDADHTDDYAKALGPAVTDPDSEVRHAAAIALENLHCRRSGKMLHHLSTDADPSVCQQASTALQRLAA